MAKKKAFALRINEEMLKAIEKWAAEQTLKNAKRAPKKKPDDISTQE